MRDDDGGARGLLDDPRCENADDSTMPAFSIEQDAASFAKDGIVLQTSFNFREDGRLGIPAVGVQAVELFRELAGALRISGGKHLNDFRGNVHASGGIDTWREAEGNVGRSEATLRWIELGKAQQRA